MALAPLVFLDTMPALERGQLWRFRDGREGVIASTNPIAVIVYVGPQAHAIPVGDLRYAFDGAALVDRRPAEAPSPMTRDVPAVVEDPRDGSPIEPLVVEDAAAIAPEEVLSAVIAKLVEDGANGAAVEPSAPVSASAAPDEPAQPAEIASAPAAPAAPAQHVRATAGRSGPRRDRKRDAQV